MAQTPSNMLPLGTRAPSFTLPDTISGKNLTLEDLASPMGTVVMFICNHCPFVIHVQDEIVKIANDYDPKKIAFVAISSNDVVNYPQDGPSKMKELALAKGFKFPYLYDESQEVARQYDAACTPDFYLFNGDLKLFYRGRLDGSRPGNGVPVTGEDLRYAIDRLIAQDEPPFEQLPSIGCNIKWKP